MSRERKKSDKTVVVGEISQIDGDRATVRIARRADRYHIGRELKDAKREEIEVENTLGLNVGDYVRIKLYTRKFTLYVLIAYAIPAIVLGCIELFMPLDKLTAIIVGALYLPLTAVALAADIILSKKKGYRPYMLEVASGKEYLGSFGYVGS